MKRWSLLLPPPVPTRSIHGFLDKTDAQKLLMSCSSGTFLIRFSEGDPGGISVAWVAGKWWSVGGYLCGLGGW